MYARSKNANQKPHAESFEDINEREIAVRFDFQISLNKKSEVH